MLAKKFRLSRPKFLTVKAQGTNHSFTDFSVKTYPNQLGYNRYSVVTSSKLHKHAVVRNRLRRHIYDLVKSFPGSRDIILFPKKSILTMTREEIHLLLSTTLFRPPPGSGGGNEGAV